MQRALALGKRTPVRAVLVDFSAVRLGHEHPSVNVAEGLDHVRRAQRIELGEARRQLLVVRAHRAPHGRRDQ